jgi:uncharacterized protein (UPF0264 family)
MTGLLVSVRSAAEAEVALAAGADLIDVKEPSRGSLGAADAKVWREVSRTVAGRTPVSVALGELEEIDGHAATAQASSGAQVQFAKCGLAVAALTGDWVTRWRKAMRHLPNNVQPVAVAYADWRVAQAPPPQEVLAAAACLRSPYLLVDTFNKSGGNLLVHLSLEELRDLSARAADERIRLVLAGSLDAQAIAALLPLAPAYVAVRGAACGGDRTQAIDASRVKRLVKLVRTRVDALCK